MIEILGIREVNKLFKKLDKVSQSVVTRSAKAGAKIARDDAKTNAPVSPGGGRLKRSIKMKAEKRKRMKKVYDIKFVGEGLAKISKNGKRSFYPVSQEYGWITQSGKKTQGKRFLRNAIDNNRKTIRKVILATMLTELKKVK